MQHLEELEQRGVMSWQSEHHAWIAEPEPVVQALIREGFAEYKRETATAGRSRPTCGGMWQGLDPRTATVATVIWVTHTTGADTHVFIEIDGRPVEGSAWAEIDDAVLAALAAGGGRLTLDQIGERVGMSADAVRSVVSMLAEREKVRIAAVELPPAALPAGPARRPLATVSGPARAGGASAASAAS